MASGPFFPASLGRCMVDCGAIMMDAHFEGAVAAEEEKEIKNKLNSKRRFCALPSPMYYYKAIAPASSKV